MASMPECYAKKDYPISLITLNNPERMNSLSPGLMQGLVDCLQDAEKDERVRCVVITGAGRAFCSGGDVKGFVVKAEGQTRPPWEPPGKELHYARYLRGLNKPVIAAINGPAVGSGFQMSLACDIRIASEKARFGAAWINVGLDAPGAVAFYLPRAIGTTNAFYLLYTGRIIDAQTALKWNLVTEVVPHEELLPHALELAKHIASKAPIPLAMNRRTTYRAMDSSFEVMNDWGHAHRSICYRTEDHLEGSKAFKEKRTASFKGK